MKLGVFTVLFAGSSFEEALDRIAGAGVDCVEIGTGNYPGDAHCRPDELLADEAELRGFADAVASRGLEISALSCHGNPLHPQRSVAEPAHAVFRSTVELAHRLGVERVNVFSGCPGDSDTATYPNWVTCAWPNEYAELLEWQWNEKVIPYWRAEASFAAERDVKLGFEMHPGFVVYNPATLLRLREACGPAVGANLDPSHLFWQGIDLEVAIAALGAEGAIHHTHAKDTAINPANAALNGVLDTTPLSDVRHRSWIFRTVGYGNDSLVWKDIVSNLRLAGYDHAISIEHEDSLMSPAEGLRKAIEFLRPIVISQPKGEAYWA